LLKIKGYLKKTYASAGKIYQPKVTQVSVKISVGEVSSKQVHQEPLSVEASTSNPEVKIENPEEVVYEKKIYDIKGEIVQTTPILLIDTFTSENKESSSLPSIICSQLILILPEVKV